MEAAGSSETSVQTTQTQSWSRVAPFTFEETSNLKQEECHNINYLYFMRYFITYAS
jgi:hypothetical protein